MELRMSEDRIDRALKQHFTRDTKDGGARVMEMLHGTLPPQKRAPRWSWPQLLLDWQFAPAWPRMVALAGCAALGFVAGSAGTDHLGRHAGARSDIAQLVFEPEPLTGLRP
jgi:hypothetical protein